MSVYSKYVPGPQGSPFTPQGPGGPWQQQGARPQAPNGTQLIAAPAPYGAPPAAPAAPYGPPPAPQYGAPAPAVAYGAPAQYGAPAPQYGAPTPQYGPPAPQYGAPAPQAGPGAAPWQGHAPAAQRDERRGGHGGAYGSANPMPHQAAAPAWQQAPAPHYQPHAGQVGAAAAQPPSAVAGCAHSYPLAVRTAGLIAAAKLSLKTLPYALFRFAHASLFAGLGMLQLCAIVGLTYLLSTYVHMFAGAAVMLAGLLAWALLWLPFAEHKMFAAWCGHIAIVTELITKGQINNGGRGMFAFGRELVAARLGEIETVWGAYRSINKALRRVGNLLNFADDLLPIDLGPVKRLMHRAVAWVAPYIEGVIVSYGLARGDRDFKAAGADGLCYSVQNAKGLFKTAFWVLLLEQVALLPAWVGALAAFVPGAFYVTYAAMGGDFAALLDGNVAAVQKDMLSFVAAAVAGLVVGGAFSLLAVKTVKEAFVKPTLLTMVMVKFHASIENQPLDQGVKARVFGANEGLAQLDGARAMLRRAGV